MRQSITDCLRLFKNLKNNGIFFFFNKNNRSNYWVWNEKLRFVCFVRFIIRLISTAKLPSWGKFSFKLKTIFAWLAHIMEPDQKVVKRFFQEQHSSDSHLPPFDEKYKNFHRRRVHSVFELLWFLSSRSIVLVATILMSSGTKSCHWLKRSCSLFGKACLTSLKITIF
jgi:hypothetical protein